MISRATASAGRGPMALPTMAPATAAAAKMVIFRVRMNKSSSEHGAIHGARSRRGARFRLALQNLPDEIVPAIPRAACDRAGKHNHCSETAARGQEGKRSRRRKAKFEMRDSVTGEGGRTKEAGAIRSGPKEG